MESEPAGEKTAILEKSSTSHSAENHQRQGESLMIKLSNTQLWVTDQDAALAFYTQKLGWEVRTDLTMPELGNFRWLAVGPSGQEDISIVLMAIPGEPVMDNQTARQVREITAKGFAGTLF